MSEQDQLVAKGLQVGQRPKFAVYIGENGNLEIWKLSNKKTGEYKFCKAVTNWNHLAERLISLSAGGQLIESVEEMRRIYKGVARELAEQLQKNLETV